MTRYLDKSFSVNVGGKAYADGWDAVFGKKKSDIRKQVEEFHQAMGQPVLDTPQVPGEDRLRLRLRLVAEEFFELLCGVFGDMSKQHNIATACHCVEWAIRDAPFRSSGPDIPDVADALADLDYVIEGMRLELGINGKPIADEVHRSNMSKLGADGKPVLRESDKKVVKGPNYSPPDIEGELLKQGWVKP